MKPTRIGVDVDDLRLPPKDALNQAAALGFRAVEMAAVAGEVAAWNLSSSGRRHLKRFTTGLGLRFAALVADIPGLHLADPGSVDERVAGTLKVIDLARDMDVPIVTASVGALSDPETSEPLPLAMEALARIGEYADSRGRYYGIRPSFDNGDRLVRVLDELGCPGIKICLDPAAMVMRGVDPLASFDRLAERIALCHARDATAGSRDHPGSETRLGEGDVNLIGLTAALESADYAAPYIIRRMDTQTPNEDIQAAKAVLGKHLPS